MADRSPDIGALGPDLDAGLYRRLDLDRLADALAARMTRPILADTRTAAAMLGMGVDAFRAHVAPHVGCVRRGAAGKGQGRALRLYRVADLETWASEHATVLTDELGGAR